MSEQKEAEQHKRAAILTSEGQQQAAINSAQGRKQAAVLEAEGAKQAVILQAEAQRQSLELQASGEKAARQLRGEGEQLALSAIDKATINPNTLACSSCGPSRTWPVRPTRRWSSLRGRRPRRRRQVLVDALGRSEDAVPAAVTNGSGGPEKNGGITSR